ncbi:DUF5615 family PIN-like protein [candidate division KSB1 bacterium]|nr:DUF5615 family PIN-like protein [candidate division KSB1 bacterium]
MNILADESVDQPIVNRLRDEGHTVLYVAEMDPGISDEVVLQEANSREFLLLTADKDFGELVFRQHRLAPGVILIRLAGLSTKRKAQIVSDSIRKHSEEICQAFSVMTPNAIRIRHK